jgi:RHS repeat-associated protein
MIVASACLLWCVGPLASTFAASASGDTIHDSTEAARQSPVEPGASPSPLAAPLVTPGSPTRGEEAQAAERAKLASPEMVAEREATRTKYESLGPVQAATVAREAFPQQIEKVEGGPPTLPAGQTITGYLTDHTAQVNLSNGKHGLIESAEPMVLETSPGQWAPVSLALGERNGAFEPERTVVDVRIPKRLSEGVQLAPGGVSLTPVDSSGAAMSGADGTVQGASVFYANIASDMDALIKPRTGAFEADTVLRSVASPEQIAYRVGLPEGAHLEQSEGASGPIRIVKEGTTLSVILAPAAKDAAGTVVPLSVSVSGTTLTITVAHRAGSYEYPILVDPTVTDSTEYLPGNWAFATNDPGVIKNVLHGIEGSSFDPIGDWGTLVYPTQGESRIYKAEVTTSTASAKGNRNSLAIENPARKIESNGGSLYELPVEYGTKSVLCVAAGCAVPAVTAESESNILNFETMVRESNPYFEAYIWGATEYIVQEVAPTTSVDTEHETVSGKLNGFYKGSKHEWVNGSAVAAASAFDKGIGISKAGYSSTGWGEGLQQVAGCYGVQCDECWTQSTCSLKSNSHEELAHSLSGLPDGHDQVKVTVANATGSTGTAEAGVYFDATPPHNITLTGLPSTHEIGDGEHLLLAASAIDGSGPESSGVASIVLAIDGAQVGAPSGGCSPGTCTAKGEWTISAENYSAGKHAVTVTATDKAGNVAKEEFELTIHHAAPISVGPGAVNSITGELSLSATDVSATGAGGGLTVGRSYRSRHLGSAFEGPLGPQWVMNVGAPASLYKTPSGNMVLSSTSGEQTVFATNGKGGYTSPPGDAGLILTEQGGSFLLSENGAVTRFTVPSGGSGSVWEPSVTEGAGGTNVAKFAYRTTEAGVTEPTQELAPVPSGVSCSPTLTKGCRALTFTYAEKTKESIGEGETEWGEYKGRLKEVLFTAYEPSSKEMQTKAVASYSYDKQGRLRAEWNPLISPALKTLYGYDGEGRLTALASAGQQPWLIEQGTSANDAAPGRVLAVARPAATTEAVLKTELESLAPVNTVVPALSSTTPTVGVKISVSSNGTWSNSPLAYRYQWQDCNTAGKECTAIPGAVNQAYYPVPSDEGHTLAAQVLALNANGSVTASSSPTSKVAAGTPNTPLPEPPSVGSLSVSTIEYHVPLSGTGVPQMSSAEVAKWGQTDVPAEATAVFPPDKVMGWPAKEYARASIYYLDGRDRAVNLSSSTGGISTTEYNLDNDVIRTLSPDNRATALAAGAEKSKELSKELDSESTYEEGGSEPGTELLSSLAPKHPIQLGNGTKVEARAHTVYSYNEGAPTEGGPYRLPTKVTQGAQYSGKEEDVRTTLTAYSGQEGLGWKLRKPTSRTVDPTGLGLKTTTTYDKSTGEAVETQTPGANTQPSEQKSFVSVGGSGSGAGQLSAPGGVATDSSGNVWVADTGHSRVQEFNAKGEFVREFGAAGTENGAFNSPHGIAVSAAGNVYVADGGNNRVQEFNSKGEFLRAFGTKGTGNGQFKKLWAVAVDGENHVWTVEGGEAGFEGPDRVQEFTAEGAYIGQFGKEGTAAGQLNEPKGIAVDAKGNVWVADTRNNRIQEFKATGELVRAFGTEGSGNGQFKKPTGLAVDAEGDLWVADTANNRLQRFSSEGGYLSQVGIAGNENGQFSKPEGVAADASGNISVADTANNRVQKLTGSEFVLKFGGSGSGAGQLSAPGAVATDSSGNVWVADTGHNRVQEFNSKGEFVREFGAEGAGNGAFNAPRGIAVSATGNVYVTDGGNNRVQEFNSKGEFLRAFGVKGTGNGQFKKLWAVAVDGEGHVWTAEGGEAGFGEGLDRVQEFTAEGAYMSQFGKEGTGSGQLNEPKGIAIDAKGNVWVADTRNNRIQEFKATGELVRAFGTEGSGNGQFKKPTGLAVDAEGDLWVADTANNRLQRFSSEGGYLSQVGIAGNENGQFSKPEGVAADASGNISVADTANNRVQKLTGSEFVLKFGGSGSGAGQLSAPGAVATDSSGNVWVADTGHNRVQEFNSKGEFVREFGAEGTENGAFKSPHGIALSPYAGLLYVADSGNNRVQEFNSKGEFVRAFGTKGTGNGQFKKLWGVAVDGEGHVWTVEGGEAFVGEGPDRVQEFTAEGAYIGQFGKEGTGSGQLNEPKGIAIDAKGNVWVADTRNNRIQEFKPTGELVRAFGKEGTGNGQFNKPAGLAVDPEGQVWVADTANNRLQRFSSEGGYLSQVGTAGNENGQVSKPEGVAAHSSAKAVVADTANNRVQTWVPESPFGHAAQTIYYSAGANATYPGCGEHAEWANLLCQIQPAKQPETAGVPNLPVTTVTYNVWDEPATTTETVAKGTEKTIRTTTAIYDAAGRLEKSAVSSTVGGALPTVTDKYNAVLGALEEQSNEGKTKPIVSHYNTLGQLTSYTDAAEGTSSYEYDVDGRITKDNDGKGTETYTYSNITGLLTELLSEYGTSKVAFTAAYDTEGNLLTEGYPNGMNANYAYNAAGEATGLEYLKTTHCTTGCTWYQEAVVPSVHGQDLYKSNTVAGTTATDNYSYDAASRLTQVQERPAGKGCTTRVYGYDTDTNRTSLVTREPGAEGKCATEGGVEERHTYDEADRLTDTGTTYNALGSITALPATDAGGKEPSEELTSSYYTDSQLESQTQNGQTIGYKLDPSGRTLETVSTGKPVVSDVINHYAGAESSPAWSQNTTTGEWTRNISGISGFAAVQVNGATPVLQLSDLHGDTIARAALSETETKLLSSTAITEYGVPTTTKPERYSWLGGEMLATELSSGVIDMGARSYVPQLGRFLQTDPVPGGSANAYAYVFGDPVNASDPSGAYTASVPEFVIESAEQRSAEYFEYLAQKAAEEAAARAAAERAAQEATAAIFTREAEIAGALKEAETSWCGAAGYRPCQESSGSSSSGGCSGTNACIAVGGCPNVHDSCYPHNKQSGAPEIEHSSRCRSGKEYHGRCVVNHDGGPSAAECASERKIVFGGAYTGLISSGAGVIDLFASTLVAQRCGI